MSGDDLTTETWLGLVDFPGYEVSDRGRVLSHHYIGSHGKYITSTARLLKPWLSAGYPSVYLTRGVKIRVHVLMLIAFRGPCPHGMLARHINDCPTDNRIENLEWGTRTANASDARRNGRSAIGTRHGMAKLTAGDVQEIRELCKAGVFQKVIAARFGITQSQVSHINTGIAWSHTPEGSDPCGGPSNG